MAMAIRVGVLFSGGKDSTYAAYLLQQQGFEITQLLTVAPRSSESYMFHHPNVAWTKLQSEAMGVDQRLMETDGTPEGELDDLEKLLAEDDVDAFASGAIASDYQWSRINDICQGLGRPLFSPLWRKLQRSILEDMLDAGFRIIVVGVYAEGLGEDWLGRELTTEALHELLELERRYGISVSGEGGEIETFVIDGPNFRSPISVKRAENRVSRDTGVYEIVDAALG